MMVDVDLARLRREYADRGIGVTDLTADPFDQFARWFAELDKAVPKSDSAWFEPNATVLSTADAEGRPSARTVLLKRFGPKGFTVFTNYESRKARELSANPAACLLFPWYPLARQVIAVGEIARLAPEESDAYFATRPRGSQLGAWASAQSEPIPDRRLARRAVRPLRKLRVPRRGAQAAALGRPDAHAADGGVLAGPAEPPARPGALRPRGPDPADAVWRLERLSP